MNRTPTPEALREHLLQSPAHFPQEIDFASRRVLFAALDRDILTQASFLDHRATPYPPPARWFDFSLLAEALDGVALGMPLHFIFHAGHVGSTLLTRLLQDIDGVLCLREPHTLQTLAETQDALEGPACIVAPDALDEAVRQQVLLWRRGFGDTRAVIVKATSTAARLAPRLLAAAPDARAVYLTLDAEPYIATALARGDWDLRAHAPERLRRFMRLAHADMATPLYALSAGELAGLAWVSEALTRDAIVSASGTRVCVVDFEALLARPGPTLKRICTHLRLDAPDAYFGAVAASPALSRHAKAPAQPFSPQERTQHLLRARRQHSSEIAKGLRWIEMAARRAAAVAALAGRSPFAETRSALG